MKGVSMPINTIIFLAIGLIVLAALVALFMGSYLTPKHTLEWQAKLNAECNKFVTAGGCDGPQSSFPISSATDGENPSRWYGLKQALEKNGVTGNYNNAKQMCCHESQ